jgi:hypothetical protein
LSQERQAEIEAAFRGLFIMTGHFISHLIGNDGRS